MSYNETNTGCVHRRKHSRDNSLTIRVAAVVVVVVTVIEVQIAIEEQQFKEADNISTSVGIIFVVHTTVVVVVDGDDVGNDVFSPHIILVLPLLLLLFLVA